MDVNVSPDKRTILLHSEKNLIVALKVGGFPLFTDSAMHLLTEQLSHLWPWLPSLTYRSR